MRISKKQLLLYTIKIEESQDSVCAFVLLYKHAPPVIAAGGIADIPAYAKVRKRTSLILSSEAK